MKVKGAPKLSGFFHGASENAKLSINLASSEGHGNFASVAYEDEKKILNIKRDNLGEYVLVERVLDFY